MQYKKNYLEVVRSISNYC